MPSTTRRRLLASVGGFLGFAGCSETQRRPTTRTENRTTTTDHEETTQHSQTTYPPQTDRPGWVGLEVENNDGVAHEVTVRVTSDAENGTSDGEKDTSDPEELFARTLTLRPQSEPEFNSVLPIPESGERRVRVAADLANGANSTDGGDSEADADSQSASATFAISADAEYQRLFVTIDHNGVLQLTQGTEPAEPIRTTTSE